MAGQVVLRTSSPDDGDFLRALHLEAHPDLARLPLPVAAAAGIVDLQVRAQQAQYRADFPDSVDQLIEYDGIPVGRCWTNRSDTELRLLDIAILSAHRSRGIGGTVLRSLCEQADAAELIFRLSVWHANSDAQRLYTELDFTIEGDDGGYLRMVRMPERERTDDAMAHYVERSSMDEAQLDYELFEQRLNQHFTLVLPGQQGNQTLDAVLTGCERAGSVGGSTGFNLTFKAGPDAPIEQGTYLLSADGVAPAPIFLVPQQQSPDGVEYHAVFTHLDEG